MEMLSCRAGRRGGQESQEHEEIQSASLETLQSIEQAAANEEFDAPTYFDNNAETFIRYLYDEYKQVGWLEGRNRYYM